METDDEIYAFSFRKINSKYRLLMIYLPEMLEGQNQPPGWLHNDSDPFAIRQAVTVITVVLVVPTQFFRLKIVIKKRLHRLLVIILARERQLQLSKVVCTLAFCTTGTTPGHRHSPTTKRVLHNGVC